ncbi:MAG: 50S ribosomal protein L10 [Deltaproteobacteria bacterium]|nr:50S ribosomal protein L10 [Deltaproteobacteria bacterium]
MQRSDKQVVVERLKGRFDRMASAVLVDFQGLDVESATALRDSLRAAAVDYEVVKNTLARRALEHRAWGAQLAGALRGMTGVAWCYEEPSTAARVLKEFARKNEKLRIKAGVIDGRILGPEQVTSQLANMPGRNQLRARLLATLQAPAQRLLQQIAAPAQKFLYLLAARKEQAGAGAS